MELIVLRGYDAGIDILGPQGRSGSKKDLVVHRYQACIQEKTVRTLALPSASEFRAQQRDTVR